MERLLDDLEASGRGVAAFMSECLVTVCGMVAPPADYFRRVYRWVVTSDSLLATTDYSWVFR